MRKKIILVFGGIVLAVGAAVLAALRWRGDPSACPYSQRFWGELPRPFITRSRLRAILAPQPGELVLEVGPGTGYYALRVAEWLAPDGRLDILDLQQKMLDHTMLEAEGRGITNIVPARGDAAALPYPDDSFDAVYTVATLGEIPQQEVALGEMRRVIKPGGRLVVGEILTDPHRVSLRALRGRAERAGLRFEHRLGGIPGYYARFVA